MLLGAPGLTTRNKKLLVAKGIATNGARTLLGLSFSVERHGHCVEDIGRQESEGEGLLFPQKLSPIHLLLFYCYL